MNYISRGIEDASWTGSIYTNDNISNGSIGHFSLACFEESCVAQISLWTTGDEYVIKPVLRNNGHARTVTLMKVLYNITHA